MLATLVFLVLFCILSGVVRLFLDDHPIRVVPELCGSLCLMNDRVTELLWESL